MYTVEDPLPSVDEYRALREAVGWTSPSPEACRTALDGSVFGVVARRRQHAVGMTRIVGDRTMYLLVVDLVVHPAHQRSGLGGRMAERVVHWAEEQGARTRCWWRTTPSPRSTPPSASPRTPPAA